MSCNRNSVAGPANRHPLLPIRVKGSDHLSAHAELPIGNLVAHELAAKLRAAEEALQRSERLAVAGRYAGAIMHEVNNPLEALSNLIFLTKIQPDITPAINGYILLAEEQVRRLGEITRKSLDFFKDQAEVKNFDVADIADSALTLHSNRIRHQSIEVRKQVRGPVLASVFASEILQILSNLILNALDAAPDQGAVLCVRVKQRGENVVVTIADNGSGIEKSIYEHLFQAHRTTKAQGTGLGLWLSHNIALKHHGNITCHSSSRPGHSGTTFRLTLPISHELAKTKI